MKTLQQLRVRAVALLPLLGCVAACDSDSPTASNGTPPAISQLELLSATKQSTTEGTLTFRFAYSDADADVLSLRFTSGVDDVSRQIPEATGSSGSVTLMQSVRLLAAGGEVPFSIILLDRKANWSNELQSTYQTPD